jgi:hypothetical protein
VERSVRPSDVFAEIEKLALAHGCRTCHRLVPFGPLAHRIDRVRQVRLGPRIAGMDVGMLAMLGAKDTIARVGGGSSPLWTASRGRAHDGLDGLWSVEPHLARGDLGAKLEEVLVVDRDGARWLDDASWLS